MARPDPRNRTHYWASRHMPGLSGLHAALTAHEYAPHSHRALVIAVTESGGSEFTSRGQVQEASGSVLLVFNPDEPHSGRLREGRHWNYRGLYIRRRLLRELTDGLGAATPPYFAANAVADSEMIAAFLALHRDLQEGGEPEAQRERLIDTLGLLYRRHGSGMGERKEAGGNRRAVELIRTLIHDQYSEPLRLEAMSQHAGMSLYQLIRQFKRRMGLTPHAYLTQIRLEAAIREMRRGASLAEAGLQAGFYDQSAFTKHFKHAYGITPLQWVRAAAH